MSTPDPDNSAHDTGVSDLYRRSGPDGPDAKLDQTILDAARARSRHRQRRWLVPVSSAALVLLGLSLVMRTVEQGQQINDFDAVPLGVDEAVQLKKHQPASAAEIDSPAAEPARRAVAPPAKPAAAPAVGSGRPSATFAAPTGSVAPAPPPELREQRMMLQSQEEKEPAPATMQDQAAPTAVRLDEIRQLLEDGEEALARERLQRWMDENPSLAVPADLRLLLPTPRQ